MEDKTIAFGVPSDKIASLFVIAAEEKNAESVSDANNQLADQLLNTLSVQVPVKETKASACVLGPFADMSIGSLLADPKTDFVKIKEIKDYGRHLTHQAKSKNDAKIARVIYYSAIAHALAHHNIKITKHSFKNLALYFDTLCENAWITDDILQLFTQAIEVCQKFK